MIMIIFIIPTGGTMPCPNVKICSCPRTDCVRHSHCCACVIFHREETTYPPHCLRREEAGEKEKT